MGSGTGYIYLYDKNSAMEMDVNSNGDPDWGWIEPQTQTSFTDAKLAGNYMLSQTGKRVYSESEGQLAVTSGGAADVTINEAGTANFRWNETMDMIYNWDSTTYGTFVVSAGSQPQASCAVISSTRLACTPQSDDEPAVMIMQQ
jgi:hypothetical protein